MRGKAIYSIKWAEATLRSTFYASVLSAGVLLCATPAHADDRSQLQSIQADIAAKERAVRQQQQQRATLLAQLKAQEQAIAAAARQLRETQNSLAQLNAQIAEMNANIAKLEKQRAMQERNLAAQLDAAFRQGEHTGIQLILSGEESQRGQRLQAYFGYLNQARQETIAELKQTREDVAAQKPSWKRNRANSKRCCTSRRPSRPNSKRRVTSARKRFPGWNPPFSRASNSLVSYGRTNPACAIALRVPKRQQKLAPSAKPKRPRRYVTVSKRPPAKAPPTNLLKVNAHSWHEPAVWAPLAVRLTGRFAARRCIAMANSYKVSYVGRGWSSAHRKAPKSKPLPMGASSLPTGYRAMALLWWSSTVKAI